MNSYQLDIVWLKKSHVLKYRSGCVQTPVGILVMSDSTLYVQTPVGILVMSDSTLYVQTPVGVLVMSGSILYVAT